MSMLDIYGKVGVFAEVFAELVASAYFLHCLEVAGVDSWSGCQKLFLESNND